MMAGKKQNVGFRLTWEERAWLKRNGIGMTEQLRNDLGILRSLDGGTKLGIKTVCMHCDRLLYDGYTGKRGQVVRGICDRCIDEHPPMICEDPPEEK
jgi:hypothetical protein